MSSSTPEQQFDGFLRILQGFETAIVVTRDADGALAGRPMAIADCTSDGHLRFVTRVEGSMIADITENPEAAVCMQSGDRYLSVSGFARTTRDPNRIDDLWDARHAVWYEKGKGDPSLVLLEIVPIHGEYWDRSGASGVKFMIQELRAMLTDDTLDEETAGSHGSVDFSDRP